jgi:hypothetical protein
MKCRIQATDVGISFKLTHLKPSETITYHLLWRSVTVRFSHSVFIGFTWLLEWKANISCLCVTE